MMLFKKKTAAPPNPNQTLERLHSTLDLLEKREVYLQKKADFELGQARALATKNRKGKLLN